MTKVNKGEIVRRGTYLTFQVSYHILDKYTVAGHGWTYIHVNCACYLLMKDIYKIRMEVRI